MNPYSGAHFFQFFAILVKRIWSMEGPMAPDEVQLAVLSCCAIACGLIAPFLVLKKMAMFANGLSHTSLLGIVGAYFLASYAWGGELSDLTTLLLGALFAALLTAGLTEGFLRLFRLQEDASVGLAFTSLFALGVILVSLFCRNAHISTEAVIGNCDALQISDLRFCGAILLCNGAILLLFYRKLQLLAFDEPFFRALGLSLPLFRALLCLMTSITCIGAFRSVGVLVVLALLVGPFVTARLFCHRLSRLLLWTPLCGVGVCLLGVALSRACVSLTGVALSTGGFIAVVMAVVFAIAMIVKNCATTRQIVEAPRP